MTSEIEYILSKIETDSPIHAKKLKKNFAFFDEPYYDFTTPFLKKYLALLASENKTLDFAVACYLNMIADMNSETVAFFRTGKYSSTTFSEVNERVYANPEIMEYYMHGLLLSQFLWKHHYDSFRFFYENLPKYVDNTQNYLEIGAGHGLYLNKALSVFDEKTPFTVVDISQTSIDLARKFNTNNKVAFVVKDIFDFGDSDTFDFICMGEVLEHVEEPLKLLQKLRKMLTSGGTLFLTTPTNAPAIDHLYLFNNVQEIRDLITEAGFSIESEMEFPSEQASPEKIEKYKIAVLYGAFLKVK
ncbi:class I SAM-dependent methyltransferase [Flavobacterium sedimenticola]|uniref:Class I SAM-dependent methyltransferase n=1 Tax=Flavobacterium sedimenticola TaxID=3043286 RepID=A0ABT6XPH8_9FLAO|nr:class I SAM-dependent methyltransferase [Flavobacterium sedimenticola]MDI9256923.1 class I SAM-dependent methyltransferase [Flavobacterium sedimenticola]